MFTTSLYTIGSVLLVSIVSFSGIAVLGMRHAFVNRILSVLISFAVGGLLGDVFIHILPEMTEGHPEFFPTASLIILGGVLLSFLLEKIIHWHHCHHVDCEDHRQPLGIISLVGDAAHNMTDGLLIATSFLVDVPTGIATTIAVILHEIPQEIGDYAILLHSGYTRGRALFLNFVTALTSVVGAAIVLVLQSSLPNLEKYLLPLVAGNFLYIAIADLLPELHKQTRVSQSMLQLLGVLAGIVIMFGLTLLE
ncbi:MAG: ZIP family metal transporter [Candidatus Peribacteraceae bacterium]|nr:ZIP family metal transporter [Candidatus Peribacteraceae bacterium]